MSGRRHEDGEQSEPQSDLPEGRPAVDVWRGITVPLIFIAIGLIVVVLLLFFDDSLFSPRPLLSLPPLPESALHTPF